LKNTVKLVLVIFAVVMLSSFIAYAPAWLLQVAFLFGVFFVVLVVGVRVVKAVWRRLP
jgi:flagellar biosynthesis component FlhA